MYYVYSLIDPINKIPFYIGKGKNKRAWDHLKEHGKGCNIAKMKYIKNIRSLGFEPEIVFIEENIFDEREAYITENHFIKLSKLLFGDIITNKTGIKAPPSRKGKTHTKEAKLKISKALKGKVKPPRTAEHLKNMSKSLKGKKHKITKQLQCPHCNTIGSIKGMGRWHFNNCKRKIDGISEES